MRIEPQILEIKIISAPHRLRISHILKRGAGSLRVSYSSATACTAVQL